jgi:hypothetical protein
MGLSVRDEAKKRDKKILKNKISIFFYITHSLCIFVLLFVVVVVVKEEKKRNTKSNAFYYYYY